MNEVLNISLPKYLTDIFPLESTTIRRSQRPVGFRYDEYIIEIQAIFNQTQILACGEAHSLELALAKATSELFERAAMLQRSEQDSEMTSNGWAAHPNLEEVRTRTIFELIEREAAMKHWLSLEPFAVIRNNELPEKIQFWVKEELSRSEFPHIHVLLSSIGFGPSVTCLFTNDQGFGVVAHSTRSTLEESIENAISEACRAAHATLRREYWNDSKKLRDGTPGKVNPGAHSVFYAYHEQFPNFLFGSPVSWNIANKLWDKRILEVIQKKPEFQFETILSGPLAIGFSVHPSFRKLTWGSKSSEFNLKNVKPHFVA